MITHQDPVRAANEEANPMLRAIRQLIREPKVCAIEIKTPCLHKGRDLQPGQQVIVVDHRALPSGFISAEDAAILLQNNAASAITEAELETLEAAL